VRTAHTADLDAATLRAARRPAEARSAGSFGPNADTQRIAVPSVVGSRSTSARSSRTGRFEVWA
jgi:hypothetical protein